MHNKVILSQSKVYDICKICIALLILEMPFEVLHLKKTLNKQGISRFESR